MDILTELLKIYANPPPIEKYSSLPFLLILSSPIDKAKTPSRCLFITPNEPSNPGQRK